MRWCPLHRLMWAVAAVVTLPLPVYGQTDAAFAAFGSLVKRINHLNIYSMTALPTLKPMQGGLIDPRLEVGVGFELMLLVSEWGAATETVSTRVGRLIEIQVVDGDTTRKYAPPATPRPDHPWSLELGFAYNDQPFQLTGEDYEIRGALRDQPAISLYLARQFEVLSPYTGLRFSAYNLAGGRAYIDAPTSAETVRVIPVSASAYALGLVLGASAFTTHGFGIFVESEVARRNFESLQWPDNTPARFPRAMRVAPPSLWVGISIDLGDIFRGS
jgi:hypothetical protein